MRTGGCGVRCVLGGGGDKNKFFGLEQELESNILIDDVNAYISVGELEGASMKSSFLIMKDKFQEDKYSQVNASFELLSDQDHLDVRENDKGLLNIFGK